MNCEICKRCIIGHIYKFTGAGPCGECGTLFYAGQGSYMGFNQNGKHLFRTLPSRTCPGCGMNARYVAVDCEDQGIDVTQEFEQMANDHDPNHWVGKTGKQNSWELE